MIELMMFIFAIFVFFYVMKFVIQIFWTIVTPLASFCAMLIVAYFVLNFLGYVSV